MHKQRPLMYVPYDQHVAGIKGGKFTLPKYSAGLTCLKKKKKNISYWIFRILLWCHQPVRVSWLYVLDLFFFNIYMGLEDWFDLFRSSSMVFTIKSSWPFKAGRKSRCISAAVCKKSHFMWKANKNKCKKRISHLWCDPVFILFQPLLNYVSLSPGWLCLFSCFFLLLFSAVFPVCCLVYHFAVLTLLYPSGYVCLTDWSLVYKTQYWHLKPY